jgi:hypothetical protein
MTFIQADSYFHFPSLLGGVMGLISVSNEMAGSVYVAR